MVASLNHILNIGSEALHNSRVGVDVSGHNIANAHTPGYTRQVVNLETKWPIQYGGQIFGDGAQVQSIQRIHDKFLEGQMRREIQVQSKSEALSKGLEKIESYFNPDLTSTVRDRFESFINSLRDLAKYPEESSVRINVIESGKTLSQTFNSTFNRIVQAQTDATAEMSLNISVLNQKLNEIALLNQEIREMNVGSGSQANDLEDKRDILIKEVGELVDINVYKDNNDQFTIRGPGESLLVEGNQSSHFVIDDMNMNRKKPHIYISEFKKPLYTEITSKIKEGKIGALIELRDLHADGVRNNLNEMARNFTQQFNSIHEMGYGLNAMGETNGRSFFTDISEAEDPAQDMQVDLSIVYNPDAVSNAMSANTPGDNVIVNKLIKLFSQPLFDNNETTVTGLYDKMIGRIGVNAMKAKEHAAASQIVYDRLKAQKESVSGVSLDDEAANLLKYQHLFAASSRVITTLDDMFKTVLDLKR